MNWTFWGMLAAIAVLLFAIFYKKYGGGLKFGRFSIRKRVVQFATPHRVELILLSFALIFFFLADLAQNQAINNNPFTYQVTVFWHITALALDVWITFLVLFHIMLMALFLYALRSKTTSRIYDIIMGTVSFFAVAILTAGLVAQLYTGGGIHFLFINWPRPLDLYHIGVYTQVLVLLYYSFTK